MSKRTPPTTTRRRSDKTGPPPTRRSGALSLLLFWPFHLLNFFTRSLFLPVRLLVRAAAYPLVASLYVCAMLAVGYGLYAQRYDLSKIHAMPERSIIFDRLGEEIGRIHGEKRSVVPLAQVAGDFRKAILAREDARFYRHHAIDPIGILRAAVANTQGKRQGASTITQQLASDVFQLKHGEQRGDLLRQLNRKLLEIAIACRIEASLNKDAILEAYINQINWGRQIRGIGEASRIYFEKHPSELTLSESAMLAGIVRGPDAYNPFSSIVAAVRERDTTLDRMVDAEVISRDDASTAKQEPIDLRPKWRRENQESYAMDAIRRDLEIILEKENLELGGLTINTTIDLRIQKKGEEALDKKLREVERIPGYPHQTRTAWRAIPEAQREEPTYLQGACVVVENRSGAVLAVIGGRDANESKFNRAIQSRRQFGSLFKPFVYLAAFDQGLRPDTSISDGPIQPREIKGAGTWRPHNSDGKFGGMEPASYGLIRSRNTMSVRVGNFAGIERVAEVAKAAGFSTSMPHNPAAFLGAWEVSPWEIATAYSIFPNDGMRFRPYLIAEIKDRKNNVLYSSLPLKYPAAKAGSAWSISRILTEVTTRGTAAAVTRLGFDAPCGGKTGTTNDFKDAWFSGFTSNLTCTVWVGLDTPRKTIQGGYGATLALPVWVDIMKTAERLGYKAGKLNSQVALVDAKLCRLSGKRATAGCETADTAYLDQVPADTLLADTDFCPLHPARALIVDEAALQADATPPHATPVPDPAKPLRALPVEDDTPPPHALPVEEDEPEPPRAMPVPE
ncbi:MAG: transglycosylase domain-containing protein [Verrucomicrobia bacterium]|nr:transglycosylase domain-containing protein [Verrucomicrobiota bacterium]